MRVMRPSGSPPWQHGFEPLPSECGPQSTVLTHPNGPYGPKPRSDGLQFTSDGLQPKSDGLQPNGLVTLYHGIEAVTRTALMAPNIPRNSQHVLEPLVASLLLVAMPGAPSSFLAPSSKARSP